MIEVVNVCEQPQYLPTLARWHHEQWSYLNPDVSLDQRIGKMQSHLEGLFIPSTYLILTQGKLAGSAAMVRRDMDTHPELSPWLASVFIAPEFRRQGLGSRVVSRVMAEANAHAVEQLYLFTPDQVPFYKKLGWETLTQENYRGAEVTVMHWNCRNAPLSGL